MIGVTSDAKEPDYENNRKVIGLPVLFTSSSKANILDLGANNIIADPDGERVWLSVPADIGRQLGNMVILLDPATGSILRRLPLPWKPGDGKLSISPNGRFLFVGTSYGNEVCRFDLSEEGGRLVFFALKYSKP